MSKVFFSLLSLVFCLPVGAIPVVGPVAALGDSATTLPITITSDCGAKEFCLWPNNCNFGTATFTCTADGGCSDASFSWQVDIGNNGSYDQNGSGATMTDTFPAGTHRILWKAKDNCGQSTTCQFTFKSKDCTPPNVLNLNGVTTPLQLPDCSATVMASQFVLNMTDNCTPTNQIQLGLRKLGTGSGFPASSSLSFTKCQPGTNIVEFWAKDNAGNEVHSNCYVIVQDNQGLCPCPSDTIRFGGKITTEDGKPVRNILMNIQVGGGATSFPITASPVSWDTLTGNYWFDVVARPSSLGYTVSIIPRKLTDPLNGVSTFDMVAMAKHVLNVAPFTSIYKMVAADINWNYQVSTFDVVELRKLILGQYSDFNGNTSWRFVRPVDDPTDFTQLDSLKELYSTDFSVTEGVSLPDVLNQNFIAVKIGDPNLSADPKQ